MGHQASRIRNVRFSNRIPGSPSGSPGTSRSYEPRKNSDDLWVSSDAACHGSSASTPSHGSVQPGELLWPDLLDHWVIRSLWLLDLLLSCGQEEQHDGCRIN